MKVPFLDLKAQYISIKDEVDSAIHEVIDNTAFILGKSVTEFEEKFAIAHQVKHCIATSSGTDANHLALWVLGIGPGDEVIVPANTFIATAWGATLCGATPVFADCHPKSYNIDPDKIEKLITKKTKAIVAVHLYGQPADIGALRDIAEKHNLFLVEDAAQAHIAEYYGRRVGGLSRISSFSFYPGKNLGAFGEGGAVLTDDDKLAGKLRMLREHGQSVKYHHQIFGHNYRMEGIQGAVLNVKLKYLDNWTEGRRRVAKKYNQLLREVPQITLPVEMPNVKHVYHLFVIRLESTEQRDSLQKFLNEKQISTGLHYPIPLHLQTCFSHMGHNAGDFPVTENLAGTGLSLPMFPELTDDQTGYVAESIKEFFSDTVSTSDLKSKSFSH
jgi:dTDP-4-amino-4,6-dideoxygalactose transaminase